MASGEEGETSASLPYISRISSRRCLDNAVEGKALGIVKPFKTEMLHGQGIKAAQTGLLLDLVLIPWHR